MGGVLTLHWEDDTKMIIIGSDTTRGHEFVRTNYLQTRANFFPDESVFTRR